jgi:ribosomal protein S10
MSRPACFSGLRACSFVFLYMQRLVARAGSVLVHQFATAASRNIVQNSPAKFFQGNLSLLAGSLSWKSSPIFQPLLSARFSTAASSPGSAAATEPGSPKDIKTFWEQFPTARRGKDWSAQIQVRGYDIQELEYACGYIRHVAGLSGVRVGNIIRLPKKSQLYTVIRSPHVYKTSREQVQLL